MTFQLHRKPDSALKDGTASCPKEVVEVLMQYKSQRSNDPMVEVGENNVPLSLPTLPDLPSLKGKTFDS